MIFKTETLAAIEDEIMPLIKKHYDEFSIFKDLGFEFDPNRAQYRALEKSNILHIFTASQQGQIVGYVFYLLSEHMHCKGLKSAFMDLIYLPPELRGQGLGKKLIQYAESELKNRLGCHVVMAAVNSKFDFSPLVEKLSYAPMDKLYYKEL